MFFFLCHTPKDLAPKKLLLDIDLSEDRPARLSRT